MCCPVNEDSVVFSMMHVFCCEFFFVTEAFVVACIVLSLKLLLCSVTEASVVLCVVLSLACALSCVVLFVQLLLFHVS